jgi:DNA-binding PadR family transcriptional regulator
MAQDSTPINVDGQASRPLNATAASLLGFLHAGPQTGWDLVRTAELRIGAFWSITRSQVYRELAAMSAAGLVVPGEAGPRDRRPYALTDAGRAAFLNWLDSPPGDEVIRFPLLLTVAFGAHLPPARLAAFAAEHRRRHEARLEGYRAAIAAAGAEADRYALATLRFGVRYEQAVLDWFDELEPDGAA